MVKKSILKRASYIGAAAMLMLTAAPIMTPGGVSAAPLDHCATSMNGSWPLYNNGLTDYLSRYGEASLCANINTGWGGLTVTDTATIDLNGHTLNGNITASGANVTILGDESGLVSGNLSRLGNGTFTIYGGTFTTDPSAYVADGYYAKPVNNRWVVLPETRVTASDVIIPVNGTTKLFEVTPAGDVSYVIRDASGADVTSTATSIATATADGVTTGTVTGLTPGEYTATITTDSDEATASISVFSYEAVNDMVLFKGNSQNLNISTTGADVSWAVISSSDSSVASVENGVVNALSSGVTTVTVGFDDTLGSTLSFRVYVYDFDITDNSPLLLKKGEQADISTDTHWQVTASEGNDTASIEAGENGAFTITGEDVGETEFTFNATVEAGTALTKTIKVYVYDVTEDEIWVNKGSTVDYSGLAISSDVVNVTASSSDASIADASNTSTYGIVGNASGDTVITYTLAIDNESVEVPVTVHVYAVNAKSTATIVKDTEVEFTNSAIAEIENAETIGVRIASGDTYISADEYADGKLTTLAKGTATIKFYAGETEVGTTEIRVYEKQNLSDIVLRANSFTQNSYTLRRLADTNLPNYTLSISGGNIATATALLGGRYRITGRNAGTAVATITYRDSLGETTETFNIFVSEYTTDNVNGNHDVAQGGQVEFTISERFDEDSVTYADDLGFDIEKGENGRYTVNVPADMASGEYVLRFTDEIAGTTIATQDVTIRVHEITASEEELFIKKGESETVTVKEANDFASICHTEWHLFIIIPYTTYECNVEVRDATGALTNDLTVTGRENSDDFELEASAAGSYTVTFSDGVATKTINVYVIDFTVEETEYHIAKGDTAPKLVKALNEYWNETAKGDTAGFVVTKENDINYYFWPTTAEAGKYELTFSAIANGQTVDTKTVDVYLYEMVAPSETEYYGEIDNHNTFDVSVSDKINDVVADMAEITYEVTEGDADGIIVDIENGTVRVTKPGKYTVKYTDKMNRGNGDIVDTFTATFEVIACEYDFLMVPVGQQVEIGSSSTWSVDTARDSESSEDLEVTDGQVILDTTDMELGARTITLYHEFARGQEEPLKRTILVIYSVVAGENSEELDPGVVTTGTMERIFSDTSDATADIIRRLTTDEVSSLEIAVFVLKMLTGTLTDENIESLGYSELFADYKNKFGADDNEWLGTVLGLNAAVSYGDEIEVEVRVEEITPADDEKTAIETALAGYDNIKYYDISVFLMRDGETIGKLHELDGTITVAIAEAEDPAAGYTRKYIVASMHNGEVRILEEGTDFYIENGIIYVKSKEFSTYAVAYQDTLIPAPATPITAPETGTFTRSEKDASGSNLSMLTVAAVAAVLLAGAAIFAKRK